MADMRKATNGPSPYANVAYGPSQIPDFDVEFVDDADIEEFAKALRAPESSPVIALNDWRPVHQRVRKKGPRSRSRKKPTKRSKDETREGFAYTILKWPLLVVVFGWLFALGLTYLSTRLYIWSYERLITWRGQRQRLRRNVQVKTNYADWKSAATDLDIYLGNEQWKEMDSYAYYDHVTVMKVKDQLQARRTRAMAEEAQSGASSREAVEELRNLVEASVKNNFAGVENPRLYSETYYGTKYLAQDFVDELHRSLAFLLRSPQLGPAERYSLSKHLHTNFGRTALCLSGGAGFAWYHFGVAKALLDASLLPEVITGTSGGALVAALVATRTNDELKKLLVPALAHRFHGLSDPFHVWIGRLYRTGARYDSLALARNCGWFCRGSTTFREAFERTGRILNVTCVPSDPHSPTILTNYVTAPDCVIWSAVLASAAVPGVINPVVLMTKTSDGTLAPYSFGHKWKDGSLRTDIPLKSLNLHFNVNFSIVSQVNPHINLFFFSSRGTVGRPVTHRKGRGWRGGFLGSSIETYLKLDLNKWLKVLRHLELLPRPLGQDWSEIWLQRFSGTVTIWPKCQASDYYYILADPSPERLARMIQVGQQSTFPRLLFIANRMKIENLIDQGLVQGRQDKHLGDAAAPKEYERVRLQEKATRSSPDSSADDERPLFPQRDRRSGMMEEFRRQSGVFFDDLEGDGDESDGSEEEASAVDDGLTMNGR